MFPQIPSSRRTSGEKDDLTSEFLYGSKSPLEYLNIRKLFNALQKIFQMWKKPVYPAWNRLSAKLPDVRQPPRESESRIRSRNLVETLYLHVPIQMLQSLETTGEHPRAWENILQKQIVYFFSKKCCQFCKQLFNCMFRHGYKVEVKCVFLHWRPYVTGRNYHGDQ